MKKSRIFAVFAALLFAVSPLLSQSVEVPAPADSRIAVAQIRVVPDRSGWTYGLGEPIRFRVSVLWDEQPLPGAKVTVQVGPEWQPGREFTAEVPAGGLEVDGGSLNQPGFIRCTATAVVGGRTYSQMGTAGVAPEKITPTQVEPDDFDAFWTAGLAELANFALEPRMTLMPEACTDKINVYHVSFVTFGPETRKPPRVYGILCEPRAPGRYPAVLRVPGAGVGSYAGERALAERGVITLEIGIHGVPMNLPVETYRALDSGILSGYQFSNLDDRERYYYRRVHLGCVRANDFLTSLPNWDGEHLLVYGGSQGGMLAIATAALDSRVTALAAFYPAYCDVTGYLHGRAGGWPHMFRDRAAGYTTPEKIATTAYYDTVNFAKRVKVPGFYLWGYNDRTCPPTSMFAAYNVITAPKHLVLALEMGHIGLPLEQAALAENWLLKQAGLE
jgi:cephalosporin-C deacetylase